MSDSAGKQTAVTQAAPSNTPPVSAALVPALTGAQAEMLALQGDAGNDAVNAALNGGNGRSLDSQTRAFMESRFGHSFNQVRVHTGDTAARASSALGADAFALGQNIWFNRGRYNPGSETGQHLLAHELAHTLQQRGGAVTPQTKLSLGTVHHPAETNADRVADAVMGNGRLPTINRSHPIIRRKPTVTAVNGRSDQRLVQMDDGKKYRVTRRVRLVEKKTTKTKGPSVTPHIDLNNVWLQIDWCEGDTQGKVEIGANVPKQAQELLKNAGQAIISGKDISTVLDGIDVTPYVSVTVTQSGKFQFSAKSEVTVDPTNGKVTRGGGSLGLDLPDIQFRGGVTGGEVPGTGQSDVRVEGKIVIPFGKKSVPKVTCPVEHHVEIVPEVTLTCEEEIPEHPETRTRPVTRTKSVYLYFHYSEPNLETDPKMPGKALNDANLPELDSLLQSNWQVNRITGYASPEGPMEQKPGSKFEGNQKLSEDRAIAARDLITAKNPPIPSLLQMRQPKPTFTEDFQLVVGKELYSPEPDENGREATGNPLAKAAVGDFLSEDNQKKEERHRTPELEKKLEARRNSPQKQAELVYPLLRRAEIDLTRQETESYQVTVPAEWRPLASCPPEVQQAVEGSFE
jgi:hypothetical protein